MNLHGIHSCLLELPSHNYNIAVAEADYSAPGSYYVLASMAGNVHLTKQSNGEVVRYTWTAEARLQQFPEGPQSRYGWRFVRYLVKMTREHDVPTTVDLTIDLNLPHRPA